MRRGFDNRRFALQNLSSISISHILMDFEINKFVLRVEYIFAKPLFGLLVLCGCSCAHVYPIFANGSEMSNIKGLKSYLANAQVIFLITGFFAKWQHINIYK